MSEPFISQINMFGFSFPPRTWAACDGQIVPIANNQILFALLGTTYGGDGRTTFGLPNLQGRVPVHRSDDYAMGQSGGWETVQLTIGNLPPHTHPLQANSSPAESNQPQNLMLSAVESGREIYGQATNLTIMGDAVAATGGGQSHSNMQPLQVINFCIALTGLYPSRN